MSEPSVTIFDKELEIVDGLLPVDLLYEAYGSENEVEDAEKVLRKMRFKLYYIGKYPDGHWCWRAPR